MPDNLSDSTLKLPDEITGRSPSWLTRNWFYLAASAVLLGDIVLALTDDWSMPRLVEAGLLLDLCVVIPALYLWCYRAKGKGAIVRALALSCAGMWIAGTLVPTAHHHALGVFGVLRYIGLGVLLFIEAKLLITMYRAAFDLKRDGDAPLKKVVVDAGLPNWVARVIAWEVTFWRNVGGVLKRLFGWPR